MRAIGGAWLQDKVQDDDDDGTTVSSLDPGNKATNTNVPAGAVEQVAKKVLPSVVQINVKGDEESGSGTGIIISSDGEILTNNHVTAVAGNDGIITVAFSDGSNAKATVVGADPKTDLAVIKASGKTGLIPATLGSSKDLEVGQEVVAIGSPFGLESTVTQGIISALNRPVTSSDGSNDPGASNTFPAIQTDAAINPGNSGGPLVDIDGNVIGINSAIKASGTGEGGSIGLGFAIPIDLAKNVSKHLVKGEKVEHAQIGVTVKAGGLQRRHHRHGRGDRRRHRRWRGRQGRPQEGRHHHGRQRRPRRQQRCPRRLGARLPAGREDHADLHA